MPKDYQGTGGMGLGNRRAECSEARQKTLLNVIEEQRAKHYDLVYMQYFLIF